MRFEPVEQRSADWHKLRLGLPTASQFDRIITPGGKPASVDKVNTYLAELIAEKLFGGPDEEKQAAIARQAAVRYGVEHESNAREALSRILGKPIEDGGFMWGDGDRYGCSPDGIILSGNQMELAEIKCPTIPTQVKHVLYGPGEGYKAQVQGQLLVSGYAAVNFISYRHDSPPCVLRVVRDETYISALSRLLDDFCARLVRDEKRAREAGHWG